MKQEAAPTNDDLSDQDFSSFQLRYQQGKALRDFVSRASHGGWEPPPNRPDPFDLLRASNESRIEQLIPIRYARMAQSPFAFFRGSAAIMAFDLASTPASGLKVQACGDAHLMNFGGFATPERNIIFDINDFDETLPAPWEWDIKRLATSLVIAARHLNFSERDGERAARDAVHSYREHISTYARMRALDVWYDRIDLDRYARELPNTEAREQLQKRIQRTREKSAPEALLPKLVERNGTDLRIKDEPPIIFHPTEQQAPGLASGYRKAIDCYRNSLPEHIRALLGRFRFRDLAIKAVGVGSVGTWCAVCLLTAADDDPLFLQIKEATVSVLEPYAGKSLYDNRGARVVAGQRLMQSASDMFLGWTEGLCGRNFYVRQLRDVKIAPIVENWDVARLRMYGRLCAWSLARAHARSGDAACIAGYLGSSTKFDDAVAAFAVAYAKQNQLDFEIFIKDQRDKVDVRS